MNDNQRLSCLLQYYNDVLRKQRTDKNLCEVLITKVMPLLSRLPSYKKWVMQRSVHVQQRDLLEIRLLDELKATFYVIKQRLEEAGLVKVATIHQLVCILETMFGCVAIEDGGKSPCLQCGAPKEKHRVYALPSYVYGIYTELEQLCVGIFALGREDLIGDYVEIKSSNEFVANPAVFQPYYCGDCRYVYNRLTAPIGLDGQPMALPQEWQCPGCGGKSENFLAIYTDQSYHRERYIDRFMLNATRLFLELHALGEILNIKDQNKDTIDVWAAYELLYSLEWAWRKSRDIRVGVQPTRDVIRKQKLRFNDYEDCQKSTRFLELHVAREDALKIKHKRQGRNRAIRYSRECILKSLDVILHAIAPNLGSVDSAMLPDKLFLCAIRLGIHDNSLRFQVEWSSNLTEIIHMHRFQELESLSGSPIPNYLRKFIEDLLESPGIFKEISLVDGANAMKYLKRVGIYGVLDKLFISQKKATGAALRATRIELAGTPDATLRKLRSMIAKLTTMEWQDRTN